MFVRNYMSANPVTITRKTTVADALDLMRRHNIRRLPVMENGELVGIVTDRDLREISPSPATSLSIFELNYLLAKAKIGDFMPKKQQIHVIDADAYIEEAALLMREHKVGALPVTSQGELVGIITETNIFDALIEIMGITEAGCRIDVEADDKPGVLADISQVIGALGVNISRIALFRNGTPKVKIVIRINTEDGGQIADKLKEHGYDILAVNSYEEFRP
ncbi:MAG: CBS domain-containing protein [Clostridia bacterium]|jgi:acetoin utilization protein AcuB|nr:CBS domain-containing protein [Clostridia bacterium]